MHFEEWLLISSVLLFASVLAWKIASWLGIPALLLFIGIGMLAGSDGPGGIYFDNAFVAQSVGVVALAFILFAAGLDTQWKVVRPALAAALALSTLGVLLTAAVVAIFALFVLHVSFLEGLLMGAIISATDAAAVFSVLRARNLHLTGKLLPLLELESGMNDPMAVFLTLGVTRLLANPQQPVWTVLVLSVQHMGRLTRFHDGLAWVMQIGMFLILGLLVFPSHLPALVVSGLLMTGAAIFFARPLSVILTLLPFKMSFREKLFVSWVGLRGAVPIVLATFPLLAGLPKA